MSPLLLSEIDHVATRELGRAAALSAVDDIRHCVRRGRAVLSEITDDHLSATQSVRARYRGSGVVGAPVPEEGPEIVGSWFGDVGQSGRCVQWVEALDGGCCPADPCFGFGSGLPRWHGLDSRAYGAQVLRQSGGVATRRLLRFKVSEAVRLGVLDAGVFHGGFPADALLACGFDLVETSAFGGFAAEGDLLRDLGELVFESGRGRRTIRLPGAVGRR
jgi:hypothetical protein